MNAFGELLEFISTLYELILGFGDVVFYIFNLKVGQILDLLPFRLTGVLTQVISHTQIADYSILVVMFGSGLTLFVGITIIKWIIGIVT